MVRIAALTALLLLASSAIASAAEARVAVEHSGPTGVYFGSAPRGHVVVVHGGAWIGVGAEQMRSVRQRAGQLTALGWETHSVDYRPGLPALRDVLDVLDHVRARTRGDKPICLYGESAGGHLALLAAERRGWVDCVIAVAPPTDLEQLRGTAITDHIQALARDVFGAAGLRRYSPVTGAARLRADVLLGYAENDEFVPPTQGALLDALVPRTRIMTLGAGEVPWIHSGVAQPWIDAWHASIARTLARAKRSHRLRLRRVDRSR